MSDEKKQNWFARHKILTGVLIVIVLAVIGSSLGGSETPTTNNTNTSNASDSNQEAQAEWKVVAELSGTEDSKQTAPFTLKEGDVRVRYEIEGKTDTSASLLYLLKEGTTKSTNERGELEVASAVDTVIGSKSGQKISKQHAGNYYLEINASEIFNYKVFIEQQ